jgi:hypothetical protein
MLLISGDLDSLRAHKFPFQLWLAILQKEFNHLLHVPSKFIETLGLTVSTRKARYVSNIQATVRTFFYDVIETFHQSILTD